MRDRKMTTLEIVKVLETKEPYKPEGKTYTIKTWYADVIAGGELVRNTVVKTFSAGVSIADGWKGEVEIDEFKNKISYVIPAPARPQSGFGGNKFGGAPRIAYTLPELEAMFKHGWNFGKKLLGDKASAEDVSRILATFVIQACNMGIKVPVAQAAPAKTTETRPEDDLPYGDGARSEDAPPF